jgi:hypothetical protein
MAFLCDLTIEISLEIWLVLVKLGVGDDTLISLAKLSELVWSEAVLTSFYFFNSHVEDVLKVSRNM